MWGAEGKDTATLDKFFTELGTERSAMIQAVSMDLGPAFLKSVRAEGHAPQALVCADVFHLVKLVGDALDDVRRELWGQLAKLDDPKYRESVQGQPLVPVEEPGRSHHRAEDATREHSPQPWQHLARRMR